LRVLLRQPIQRGGALNAALDTFLR
jgi:hypothetical protein